MIPLMRRVGTLKFWSPNAGSIIWSNQMRISGTIKQNRVLRAKALRKNFPEGTRSDIVLENYRVEDDYVDYLYGVHPVLAALLARRRTFDNESVLYLRSSLYKRLFESSDAATIPASTTGPGDVHRLSAAKLLIDAASEISLQVTPVHKSKLDKLCQFAVHQGVCLKVGKFVVPEINLGGQSSGATAGVTSGDRDSTSQPQSSKFALLLDAVQDPMNLGGMIRSAAFLGVGPIFLSPHCCSITPVVSKASVGAAETISMYKLNDVTSSVQKLLNDDWLVIGSSNHSDVSTQISDLVIERGRNVLLVLGSEGSGLKPEVDSLCTQRAYISPGAHLPEGLDSLNVSVAAGILMQHIKSCLG